MSFGGGSKPAKMLPTPKVVATAHKGPPLNLGKPTAKGAFSKPSPKSACCGNK